MPSGVEPSELDVLEHLLKTEPDGTPCELAACLRGIQCYQVTPQSLFSILSTDT